MRLRTKLALALVTLALLPAGILGWVTLRTLSVEFEEMFQARLADAERALHLEVQRTGEEVQHTVGALAGASPAIEEVARAVYLGEADLAALVPLAQGLMAGLELQALFLLDDEGRVLSSGHLPARFGYDEPDLAALSREDPGQPSLRWIELRRGQRIDRALAILSARPVHFGGGERLHVVGGRLLDAGFVQRLSQVTGSAVRLTTPEGEAIAEAPAPGSELADSARLLGGGLRVRTIRIGQPTGAALSVSVSDAPLALARARVLTILLIAGGLLTLGAVLLAGLLASRITKPVDALATAARTIARGDYAVQVETRASGELGHLVSAFNTMTGEIRNARERIAAAERVAAWREIARRLAHEIKNPLMPISTSIETLRRTWKRQHPQFEEIFEESTQAILEEVEALRRIVDEFSRFARLPAPEPTTLPAAELVEGTLALFPEPPAGIRLTRELAPGLPAVFADREQLQQVLLNLVTNAVQAIQGAKGSGTVLLRARLGEGEVLLEVEDDGPGIDPEHRPELFTPYFTTKEGGTGLGLAICHRIVAEHGGRIEVESHPGQGARFRVALPLAPPEVPPE